MIFENNYKSTGIEKVWIILKIKEFMVTYKDNAVIREQFLQISK